MSRTKVLLMCVFVMAGLSGCATPAHLVSVDRDAGRVVVAVPEDTNTWPFYYRDEAFAAAAAQIPEPELRKVTRVKVGEQMTNIQDSTRRDLGKDKEKVGEVVTSTNTTSVSDKYEFHMEYVSASAKTPNFLNRRASESPPAPTPGGAPMTPNPIQPVGGEIPAPAVTPPGSSAPALDIRPPSVVPPTGPQTTLPGTYLPGPGR